MIKKSDNMTSILALIVGLAALTVAIVALVNNKKDDFTADDSSCCMSKGQTCKDEKSGWCIGTDGDALTFNLNGVPKFKLNSDGMVTGKIQNSLNNSRLNMQLTNMDGSIPPL